MRPLRIVRLLPFYTTRFGGCVTQARSVSRTLAARGHDVRIVTTDLGCDSDVARDTWIEEAGTRIWYGTTRSVNRVVPYWAPMLRGPLSQALLDADVLTLNVGLTLANDLARRLARGAGVPYVYNAEGALCPDRLRIKGARKKLFLRVVERRVLQHASALQAVTSKEHDDLVRQGAHPDRVRVIPNAIDVAKVTDADGAAFRTRCGLPRSARVVLFLGRLHPIKGIDLLLQGFARIAADVEDAVLVIAGPDEVGTAARLQTLASDLGVADRVVLPGLIDAELCPSAFAAADVFALTSRTEGLPNAVLEACAHGVPVLVSRPCNVPEVATFGAGRICELAPEAIAGDLRAMLADADARARMGEAGRRMVRERFALDLVAGYLEQLYGDLVGTRDHGRT